MTDDAAKLVSSAVIGVDFRVVTIAGRTYVIHPPTIHRLASAVYWLSDIKDGNTLRELLQTIASLDNLARAISCLIQGDDSLCAQLSEGTLSKLVDALETAFSLIDTGNFLRLSVLARSAKMLTARQRQ